MIPRSFHELETAGFDQLDPELRQAVVDLAANATRVLVAHVERNDWREVACSEHADRSSLHALMSVECSIDDDGLPNIDHAAARLALYYGRKRLGE